MNKYSIEHKYTTPAHPQTNGKVERWNYQLVDHIQRIAAEDGNWRDDWDLYVKQALFAYHAHYNPRVGATPFYLQYGVEPVLPSQQFLNEPLSRVERAEVKQNRREHVKDLNKYQTEAAEK